MFKKLTKEELEENARVISAEYDQRSIDDDEFYKAVLIVGKWLKENYMKVGYKRLGRMLVYEYLGSMKGKGVKENA
jgi:uncharacterized protein YgbK (DUF1537 family)